MDQNFKAVLKSKGEIKTGTGQKGTWKKRDFIVEEKGAKYPKPICLTAWNKVAESMDSLSNGDEFTVFYNLESREYKNNWYTEVKPSRFEDVKKGDGKVETAQVDSSSDDSQDLPF